MFMIKIIFFYKKIKSLNFLIINTFKKKKIVKKSRMIGIDNIS